MRQVQLAVEGRPVESPGGALGRSWESPPKNGWGKRSDSSAAVQSGLENNDESGGIPNKKADFGSCCFVVYPIYIYIYIYVCMYVCIYIYMYIYCVYICNTYILYQNFPFRIPIISAISVPSDSTVATHRSLAAAGATEQRRPPHLGSQGIQWVTPHGETMEKP